MIAIHRPEVAADFLRKLVVDNPSNLEALNALGVAYDLLGDHAAATGTYRQALAMVPASNAVRNNLALSLALQENFAEAVQLLRPLAEGPGATRRSRQNLL
jgi:Flp pilus assembly protein TadD